MAVRELDLLREFHEQGFDICLRSWCADSSSPQICVDYNCGDLLIHIRMSAIHVGHFTWGNYSLRTSPQFFTKLPQQLCRQMSKSRLAIYIYIYTHVYVYISKFPQIRSTEERAPAGVPLRRLLGGWKPDGGHRLPNGVRPNAFFQEMPQYTIIMT